MVLMIASDLHGSAYWTKQLLDAFRKEGADRLLLLGDLLDGIGAESSEDDIPSVAEQLNAVSEHIIAVRGNCDFEEDQALLDFPMMADHLLVEVNGLCLYAAHGHLWPESARPDMEKASVIVYGHTHIPERGRHEDRLTVNPGSAAFPRGESVRGYVVVRGRTFSWSSMDGTVRHSYTVRKQNIADT